MSIRPIPVQRGGEGARPRKVGDVRVDVVAVITDALAEQAPVVALQQLLGNAFELVEEHVPRLHALFEARRLVHVRVSDREAHQMVDAAAHRGRGDPRQRCTPVVGDDVRARDLQSPEQRGDVADDVDDLVVTHRGRLARVSESA